jgi:DNA-binding XRE family transcriptional regulator
MSFELIVKDGKTFALVPVQEYGDLLASIEMNDDIAALERAKQRLDDGEDEIIPIDIVRRRINGENPLKIWRQYRNLTQEQLSQASGVSRGMIGAIEAGHRTGSVEILKKLSAALKVDIEDIA